MAELAEMREFEKNPSPENARKLGLKVLKSSGRLDEKRMLYVQALEKVHKFSAVRSILRMWMIGSFLEAPVHYTEKVIAVRDILKDPNLTPELIEEWAWAVFEWNRAPKDLLDFIAVDIRNLRGISRDLRAELGHPSPDQPFRED